MKSRRKHTAERETQERRLFCIARIGLFYINLSSFSKSVALKTEGTSARNQETKKRGFCRRNGTPRGEEEDEAEDDEGGELATITIYKERTECLNVPGGRQILSRPRCVFKIDETVRGEVLVKVHRDDAPLHHNGMALTAVGSVRLQLSEKDSSLLDQLLTVDPIEMMDVCLN